MGTHEEIAVLQHSPRVAGLATSWLSMEGNRPGRLGGVGKLANRRSPGREPAPRKILIVEDEALMALDMCNALGDTGCEVVGLVATERAAIQKAAELEPDLVIMDIRLKGAGDGLTASQKIIAARPVPILYITAFRDQETMSRLDRLQPAKILFKPFNRQTLLAAVEKIFETYSP